MPQLEFLRRNLFSNSDGESVVNSVNFTSAPGELASFSVGIRSPEAIASVLLSATAFNNGFRVAIDLRLITKWSQAGIGIYQSAKVLVHELLLKDDSLPLSGSYSHFCEKWFDKSYIRSFLKRSGPRFFNPPVIRTIGPVSTSFAAGECKRLWGSLKIPYDTPKGTYKALIQAFDEEKNIIGSIVLSLEVLPFTLVEPRQDCMIWYKGTLDCARSQFYVPQKRFRQQLQDIFDHGFSSISFHEYKPRLLKRALKIAADIGFRRNIVLSAPFFGGNVKIESYGLKPIYYVSDEPDIKADHTIHTHIRNWHRGRKKGVRTFTSLINHAYTSRLNDANDIGHRPDIISLFLPTNRHFIHHHSAFEKGTQMGKNYYYWHAYMEKPNLHRVLAGVYLWKSGADGISPYCYQHPPIAPFNPFDDFDEWEPNFHVGAEMRPFKDHMATYPCASGSIPTLQWKGMAEGIRDLKYLATLDAVLREADSYSALDFQVVAIREHIENFLQKIDLKNIEITSETEAEPFTHLKAEDYDDFRENIIEYIVLLKRAMHHEMNLK